MTELIKGLDLCEGFYEHAKPIIDRYFPDSVDEKAYCKQIKKTYGV